MSTNGISHPPKGGKMTITRVKQRVSKKSKCWLEVGDVLLSEEHKSIIESNTQWLDDAIINASQYLLHSQYGISRLQATTLGYHLTFDIMRKDFVQIFHNGEDHWLTISPWIAIRSCKHL